jgi:ubiquinone biosynthesis protein UbiJ
MLLNEHFDVEAGQFLSNWSDAKIAERVGWSLQAVVEFREGAYGPIKEDPKIAAARLDVDAVRSEIQTLQHMVDQLNRRLHGLYQNLARLTVRMGA